MKFIFALFFTLALLTGCGSSDSKHDVIQKEELTLADMDFIRYEVDNQYSISVPSFLNSKPEDPDRYSFEFTYNEAPNLDNVLVWGVKVESDSLEGYESRRKEQGNLDKYPFTLEGFHAVTFAKPNKDMKLIGEAIADTINGKPALVQEYKVSIDWKLIKASAKGYIVSIQGNDGKLYRLNIYYPASDTPEMAIETYKSFKQPI